MSSRDLVVAAAGASGPSDPNFKNVSLLLSGDGTNGAQNNTFLDSSTNNFTITRNGNTTQGTFSPYGNLWSNYFDGSSNLATASLPSMTNFTAEAWFYLTSATTNNQNAISIGGALILGFFNSTNNDVLRFACAGVSTPITGLPTKTSLLNTWNHVAMSRSGSSVSCYLNGTLVATLTAPNTVGSGSYILGSGFVGYVSNARVVNGTALYSGATITVPAAPLTAISGTSLLTCQSNRFMDNSSNNFTLTVNGNTSVQRFSPFNPTAPYSASTIGGSGYFDGNGDFLGIAYNSAFLMGTSTDFCMEGWVYPTETPGDFDAVYSSYTGATTGNWIVAFSSGKLALYQFPSINVTLISSNAIKINSWTHFVINRSGSDFKLYINGVQESTLNGGITMGVANTGLQIGRYASNDTSYFKGYISNLRHVVGSAVYTSNFTPPTAPLTAITNTSLLLNFTNAGVPDAAMMNDLETVGNAQVSTSVKKYGTGSLYFDGTGDWLLMPSTPNMSLGSGDFTIEGWLYPGSQPGSFNAIVGSSATGGPILNLRGSGTSTSIGLNSYGSADIFNISYTFTQNTWVHVAVARSGTNLKLFINGTQTGSTVTNSTNFSGFITSVGMADNGNQVYNGYIDDLRITKGYARYTSSFTPPTQALPTN